jgi:hypothetical protein
MLGEAMSDKLLTGRCLCGAIEFSLDAGDLKDPGACHCSQCRRWAGHCWAAVNAPLAALSITKGEDALKWYRASDYARRGFCNACGSSLFWQADKLDDHKDRIAVALGALDAPTGLKMIEHIFVADKGDYYDIADGLAQKATF